MRGSIETSDRISGQQKTEREQPRDVSRSRNNRRIRRDAAVICERHKPSKIVRARVSEQCERQQPGEREDQITTEINQPRSQADAFMIEECLRKNDQPNN